MKPCKVPRLNVPDLDRKLGIEFYGTKTPGVGGCIKAHPEDFIVQEVLRGYGPAEARSSQRALAKEGKYLLATLEKEGWDTLHLIRTIAWRMRVDERRIRVAGIKDARARTIQYVTVENVSPTRLESVMIRDARLTPLRYVGEPLSSEQLVGNNFRIRVRHVKGSRDEVEELVQSTHREIEAAGGVPNFYGHQRFGTIRPITHLVGRHLVKRRFQDAVFTYLTEGCGNEDPRIQQIRQNLKRDSDYDGMLRNLPQKYLYERIMLEYLDAHPEDYVGALRRLPFQLRRMFINAYQGYLFNLSLSRRLQKGLRLDRVYTGDWALRWSEEGVLQTVKVDVAMAENVNGLIEAGVASVGLPVPGYRTELSDGPQDRTLKQLLKEEEVSLKAFYVGAIPEISGEGKVRGALSKVLDFKFHSEPGDDEIDLFLGFALNKESYATVVLREFMKAPDPVAAGF